MVRILTPQKTLPEDEESDVDFTLAEAPEVRVSYRRKMLITVILEISSPCSAERPCASHNAKACCRCRGRLGCLGVSDNELHISAVIQK